MRRIAMALLLVTGLAAPATAQQAAPRALTMAAVNVSAKADTARARRSDTRVRPGDVVRYTLTFRNPSAQPVSRVVLQNPIPSGFVLVPGSARATRQDARLEYSVDGGATYSLKPIEEVVVDGRRIQRPVPIERYTNIRWTVDGAVSGKGTVVADYETRLAGRTAATPAAAPGSVKHRP